MALKLLLVDAIYPAEWLTQARTHYPGLESLPLADYERWLKNDRLFFTSSLIPSFERLGFECKIFISTDDLFLSKLNRYLNAKKVRRRVNKSYKEAAKGVLSFSAMQLIHYFRPNRQQKRDSVLAKMIDYYQPDIIFVREPTGVDTFFWNKQRQHSLVASFIGCNTSHPNNWKSHNYDVIFSLTPEYEQFFKVQGIPSYQFGYGVEKEVYQRLLEIKEKVYEVTFVGLLGSRVQLSKTKLMEAIAEKFDFNWWGPQNVDETLYPYLFRTYRGLTSGFEMLKIYRQSRIVVNDYVDTANGTAVNLRLFEVLNTGSFLLTRRAANLADRFPADIIAMYDNESDCLLKLAWYLNHEGEREEQAARGCLFALKHCSYEQQVKEISQTLLLRYNEKFKTKTHAETPG